MSRVMAGRSLLACIRHVRNQSYIPCYHLAQEQEGLGYEGLLVG